MRNAHNYLRAVGAMLALVVIAGCGAPSLESVGDRSAEWIGSVTNGVTFMPREPHLVMLMVTS